MDNNIVIFIDAGYLFKQGSGAVLGTKLGRHEIEFDADRFNQNLITWVKEEFPDEKILRTYWYDGTYGGVLSPDQIEIAILPFVKFRAGRINSAGHQKGVDTLIVRDLMVLSQEHSIYRAMVISGDEDLREGIIYAQDRGVRVAVVGINFGNNCSQSQELVREADQVLEFPLKKLERTIKNKIQIEKRNEGTQSHKKAKATKESGLRNIVETFTTNYLEKLSYDKREKIYINKPKIPHDIDAHILQSVTDNLKIYPINDLQRKEIREVFWEIFEKIVNKKDQQ